MLRSSPRFTPVGANSCRVWINGEEAGFRFQGPYAFRIDPLLRAGMNRIELELTTSLRNLLGPHHLDEGESYSVNTRSFDKEPNAIDNPAPPWNDGYCFVKLGLRDLVLA